MRPRDAQHLRHATEVAAQRARQNENSVGEIKLVVEKMHPCGAGNSEEAAR